MNMKEALEKICDEYNHEHRSKYCHDIALEALSATRDEATTYRVDYDGFVGTMIGTYRTREGREGVVLQQVDTKIVHVYGANRVEPVGDEAKKSEGGKEPRGCPTPGACSCPSNPTADKREIVARIINPAAFDISPAIYGLKTQEELEKKTQVGAFRRIARDTADKILATLDNK